jgi:pyruvate formate lyase activating enzyme
MLESSKLAKKKGLYVVTVTNGLINPKPFAELAPLLDATNIDIKSFDDRFYRKYCKGPLQPVLDNAIQAKEAGVHVELTTLVIPTRNDDPDMMREQARWILDNLGEDTPLHLSRFRPEHRERDLPPTPKKTIVGLADIARGAGLRHVFIGNMYIPDFSDTGCPQCAATVIARKGFETRVVSRRANGRCPSCKTEVYRSWKGGKG